MAQDNDITAASIAQQIHTEFGDLEPPGDDALLHPDCMDDGDIVDFYGNPRWQDLSSEKIVANYAAPSFFSPLAFRYYLPAFLVWTLENPDSPEVAGESIIHALDPGTPNEHLHEFRYSKFQSLTDNQFTVVRNFLIYFSAHNDLGEPAASALMNYWRERH